MVNWYTDDEIAQMLAIFCGHDDVGCWRIVVLAGSFKNVDIIANHCTKSQLPIPGLGNARSLNIVALGCDCPNPPPQPGDGVLFVVTNGIILVQINDEEAIMPQPGAEGGSKIVNIEQMRLKTLEYTLMEFHCHPTAA